MSKLIPTYIEQALRIEVLERAVIASESDVEQLEGKLAEAIAKERERCAKVCDEFYSVVLLQSERVNDDTQGTH